MKYALILPGNLSTYFVSLDTLKQICDNYDIDIYILYSKINYIHTLFENNKTIEVEDEDIDFINNKLTNNIKYFKAIEDIPEYNSIINNYIMNFQKNILWTKELTLMHNFTYDSFMNYNRTKKYLDQFVRINYLYKTIEKENIKYDYIIRARIDQYIDYKILYNTLNILN